MMRRLLILLLALWPAAAWAQFPMVGTLWPCSLAGVVTASHVQGATASSIPLSSTNTYTLAFTNTVTTGHGVMGMVRYGNSSTLSSITDDAGNSYTIVNTINDNPGNFAVINFYNTSVAGTPKTLSFIFGAGQLFYNVRVAMDEYSNVSSFDTSTAQELTNPGTGANALTSGSITTAVNQELVYATTTAVPGLSSETISAGSGYSLQQFGDGVGDITGASESQVQTSAGAISGTFTTTLGTPAYVTGVMAFKPTSAQSSCNVPPPPTATFIVATNGNDSWSGLLAAPNSSATDGPFASLGRCQLAMRNSPSIKACSIRAGTYFLTVSIDFSTADNNTTWQFYAPDGYNTAIIDGGSSSPTTGIDIFTTSCCGGNAGASTNPSGLIFNGLKIQNMKDMAFNMNANNTTVKNSDIGNNHDASEVGGFSPCGTINGTNVTWSHNYVHDCVAQGISTLAFNLGEKNDGTVIDSNVIIRACKTVDDCAPIYQDQRNNFPTNSGATSNHVTISNNFARDFGFPETSGIGFRCIYMDDDSSLTTITGNVCGPPITGAVPPNSTTGFMNGGDGNTWTGNVLDNGTSNVIPALGSGNCGQGGTIPCSSPTASPNNFNHNIVLMNFAGASNYNAFGAYGNHQWGDSYTQSPPAPGGVGAWLTVSTNLYHNKGGGVEDSTATDSAANDNAASHANPGCSGLYNFSSLPAGFVQPQSGWGPPGFTIPSTTTVNSC